MGELQQKPVLWPALQVGAWDAILDTDVEAGSSQ